MRQFYFDRVTEIVKDKVIAEKDVVIQQLHNQLSQMSGDLQESRAQIYKLRDWIPDNERKINEFENRANMDELRDRLRRAEAEKEAQNEEYREELGQLNERNEALKAEIGRITRSNKDS